MKIQTIKNLAFSGACLVASGVIYTLTNDAKNYNSTADYQQEIMTKDPKRYNKLINTPISARPMSFNDWKYEAKIMNDSLKYDSLVKKAYFEGAQMVRDSIKNMRIK